MPDLTPAAAHGLSFMSSHARLWQRPHDWMMKADAPSYTPVRWQIAAQDVDSIRDWAEFEGNPDSGRIPRWYRTGAIINVERDTLDELQSNEGGWHAAAYALGSAIVVAEVPGGFGHEMTDEDRYAVGLRIGRGTLQMTAGLWHPEDKRLVVPEDSLHRVETVPVDRFPSGIPLL